MKLVSYLTPGLPEELFEAVATVAAEALGVGVAVAFVTDRSGPPPGPDPLGAVDADLAVMCAPAFVDLRAQGQARLVPAAPVFTDPRIGGRPCTSPRCSFDATTRPAGSRTSPPPGGP